MAADSWDIQDGVPPAKLLSVGHKRREGMTLPKDQTIPGHPQALLAATQQVHGLTRPAALLPNLEVILGHCGGEPWAIGSQDGEILFSFLLYFHPQDCYNPKVYMCIYSYYGPGHKSHFLPATFTIGAYPGAYPLFCFPCRRLAP